ncbi:MAG: TlpA family protein disulfide reductase [Anaerolineae bacterium]|nr:TlpA family protein disulfide reductase [Anaerolineae bacterium]
MNVTRYVSHSLVIPVLLAGLLSLTVTGPAAAQEPGNAIEALALQAHLQNLRTQNYTFWIGGNLGDARYAPRYSVTGEVLGGWTLAGLNGDNTVTLETLERPALLNFWASWCAACRIEFPRLTDVALAPDGHAFDLLFVNMSDTRSNALAFLADQPPAIHTVIDEQDVLARRAYINAIPSSILIDTDGTVLAVHVGILTSAVIDFLDAVAAQPGVGQFDASVYTDVPPAAVLQPVDTASADPLQPGERVSGTITDAAFQHAYRFSGHAGDVVGVRLQADDSNLDTYLVLMTADGERLAENDDDESSSNSFIECTLPVDGEYIVVATRFLEADGFGSGAYTLLLTVAAGGSSQPAPGADEGFISYGSTVIGQVSGNDPRAFYSFEGQAGDVITLQIHHPPDDEPLRIELKDTHLDRLAVTDPSADGEAALVDVELPENGNYLVIVYRTRSRDTTYQDFTLTLTAAEPKMEAPLPDTGSATLAYGGLVSGTLDDNTPAERWTFAGQHGDVITLVMTRAVDEPGGLDGYLILLGPDGDELASVDDYGSSVMPTLLDFELLADGMYTVVATRFGFENGFSTGDYSLSLALAAPDDTSGGAGGGTQWIDADNLPADLRRIEYNERVTGTISADNVDDWYSFDGRTGDVISIRLAADGSELDAYLLLLDSNGRELASNDDLDDDSGDAAILDFTLPADDMYLLRATRYGFNHGLSGGDYVLLIELAAGEPARGSLDVDDTGDMYTLPVARATVIKRR